MTDKDKNEQPQPENQDEEQPVEDQDPELLPDREAMSVIGGETHGLGPPVP